MDNSLRNQQGTSPTPRDCQTPVPKRVHRPRQRDATQSRRGQTSKHHSGEAIVKHHDDPRRRPSEPRVYFVPMPPTPLPVRPSRQTQRCDSPATAASRTKTTRFCREGAPSPPPPTAKRVRFAPLKEDDPIPSQPPTPQIGRMATPELPPLPRSYRFCPCCPKGFSPGPYEGSKMSVQRKHPSSLPPYANAEPRT
jgi:hypothetical protein